MYTTRGKYRLESSVEFDVDEEVDAMWFNGRFYPATVKSHDNGQLTLFNISLMLEEKFLNYLNVLLS